ncbi:MAG: LapA family protein [Betaproteobacteria bacterium]|nr:LapA family protein [Betaproteobacteria bacterium]MDH4323185.1 LapA family protein [Betaproteobacteria bacterium]MDH5210408.1 LapA family protein [Betaproteobacteria bacterium]MDH5579267.1 LapA family protein [Betaproteobacteria bacterium]
MRFLTWTIRIALFILLLAFAARNTETATLRFYFDLAWQAPLIVLLLAFFAAGAVLGLLAALGAVLRQRREAARLRRELRAAGVRLEEAQTLPPPPAEG